MTFPDRLTWLTICLALTCLLAGCAPPPDQAGRSATTQPDQAAPLLPTPEADVLYNQGIRAYQQLRDENEYDEGKSRAVLDIFLDLLARYPQSDKVDDAYFYCGQLLYERFNRYEEAAEYFRRAYQADPNTPRPARFQRASVLDFRLNRHEEAVQEYRRYIQEQSNLGALGDQRHIDYAAARIRALTGGAEEGGPDPAAPEPADQVDKALIEPPGRS